MTSSDVTGSSGPNESGCMSQAERPQTHTRYHYSRHLQPGLGIKPENVFTAGQTVSNMKTVDIIDLRGMF